MAEKYLPDKALVTEIFPNFYPGTPFKGTKVSETARVATRLVASPAIRLLDSLNSVNSQTGRAEGVLAVMKERTQERILDMLSLRIRKARLYPYRMHGLLSSAPV